MILSSDPGSQLMLPYWGRQNYFGKRCKKNKFWVIYNSEMMEKEKKKMENHTKSSESQLTTDKHRNYSFRHLLVLVTGQLSCGMAMKW